MKNFLRILICLYTIGNCTFVYSKTVNDYRPVFIPVYLHGQAKYQKSLFVAIRAFEDGAHHTQYLVVDTRTFDTQVIAADKLDYRNPVKKNAGYITNSEVQATRYARALRIYTQPPFLSSNQGLRHGERVTPGGAYLSVDLCPSVNPFEKDFFKHLVALQASSSKYPIPVAISISGLWLLAHQPEFLWLSVQRKAKRLAITWVNHSFSHLYFPDIPLESNFLTLPNTNIDNEFLDVERLLIMQGETPSVWVRMPGLISNKAVVQAARRLGLIPLGADAWLARNQPIQDGSIVLVHGNGNEPEGIKRLLPLLSQWQWLDLKASVYD